MPEQDHPVWDTDDACGRDVFRLPHDEQLATHQSGGLSPVQQPDDDDDRPDAGAHDGHENDDQQQRRDGEDRVGQAHEGLIDDAAVETGRQPQERPDHEVQRNCTEPDHRRGSPAIQHP